MVTKAQKIIKKTEEELNDIVNNLLLTYGKGITKHQVRMTITLSKKTRGLPYEERDSLVNRLWYRIKKIL